MITSELVQRIALQNPKLYQRDVEKIIKVMVDEIIAAMARADRVELRGFGKRAASTHGAQSVHRANVSVQKKSVPSFKTGKEMRRRLNRPAPSA